MNFKNEPFTDFTIAENRAHYAKALEAIDQEIKRGTLHAYPIINGEELRSKEIINSIDPSDSSIVVGKVHFATKEDALNSIAVLKRGSASWADTPAEQRAKIMRDAAAIMRRDKYQISALITREAGKPWKEADADLAEAIDFCEYYAAEMTRLGKPQKLGEVMGEENFYFYQPRGICAVIAPWNFPLAIACGMTVAALVTGNATILKPSQQTSLIAYRFAKILLEAGLPADSFAFLPGWGKEVGSELVASTDVEMICFTGSKAVGLEIIRKAGCTDPKQLNVKKVVAEMGGKNAVIVDEDADLDEVIKGVIQSAFGYAGQKCSACSRLIVVGDAYETLLPRLTDAASDIIVGQAKDPSTFLGPVIDEPSQKRILKTIADAKKESKLAYEGKTPNSGYFVPAVIFKDVSPTTSLWKEEIFGPVLAVTKAKDFEEALSLANDSQYALTGGIFSRSPANLETGKKRFKVGNLYINRGCTGALVYRQPFGGFRMSGVGSKAGGPDYLIQFMEPRVVTENTMRRGFAPELS